MSSIVDRCIDEEREDTMRHKKNPIVETPIVIENADSVVVKDDNPFCACDRGACTTIADCLFLNKDADNHKCMFFHDESTAKQNKVREKVIESVEKMKHVAISKTTSKVVEKLTTFGCLSGCLSIGCLFGAAIVLACLALGGLALHYAIVFFKYMISMF